MTTPPVPRFIPPADAAAISARIVGAMKQKLPAWRADVSDPGVYWADLAAQEIAAIVEELQAAMRDAFVPTTTSAEVMALRLLEVGLARRPNESIDSMRSRWYAAWRGRRSDTLDYFRDAANAWWQTINEGSAPLDVSAEVRATTGQAATPYEAVVYAVLANGSPLGIDLQQLLQTSLQALDTRPLWLSYRVGTPETKAYDITCVIHYAHGVEDRAATLSAARTALDDYMDARSGLGDTVTRSGLVAAAIVDGVVAAEVVIHFDGATPDTLPPSPSIRYTGTISALTASEQ